MARPISQKTIVSRLFAMSERPIYIVDGSGRVVFSNRALWQWLDVTEEQLKGVRCSYSTSHSDDELSNCLAVPPQARVEEHRARIVVENGVRKTCRWALFLPLCDQFGSSTLVLVDEVEAPEDTERRLDADALHRELRLFRKEWSNATSLDCLVGQSAAMQQARNQLSLAGTTPCRVVLVGNPGSGRTAIARAIHCQRTKGTCSLVPLSCELLDAELLQTTIEAFVRQSAELEDETPGTLLLLEVDKLSMEAQSALLGFLEIVEFEAQTIATCQTSLLELSARQAFRSEIAHHLTGLEIRLPPLADRLEDVPILAQWFLERSHVSERVGGFAPEAMERLLRYGWPREVDEVQEVVQAAAASACGTLIAVEDLPQKLTYAADAATHPDLDEEQVSLDEFLSEVEAELIMRALRQAKGNRAQAARLLNVSRARLLRRIDHLGIEDG